MRSRLCSHVAGFLLLLSPLFFSGCAVPEDWHVASDEDEGGIIGTGIIGTITDIGSIYVNGLRVTYDADLEVETAFGRESAEQLAPGDTVKVEATWVKGGYHAMSIERYRPIIAPIEAVADDQSWVEALGVRIRTDETARIYWENDIVDRRILQIGAWITVDGIWKGNDVIASNVRRIGPSTFASVRGVARRLDDRSLSISGVRVGDVQHVETGHGSVVAAQGVIKKDEEGSYLAVEKIAIKRFSPAVRHVLVEGFLSTPSSDGAYTVYGTGLTSYVDDPKEPMDQRRSVFCGTLNGTYDIKKAAPIGAGSDGFRGPSDAEPNDEKSSDLSC